MKPNAVFDYAVAAAMAACLAAAQNCGAATVGPIQWASASGGNNHYYDFIAGNIQWTDANVDAQSRVFQNVSGHLATITSVEEKEFLRLNVVNQRGWLGGFQDNQAPDYSEPDGGWRWITGETWDYANWAAPEPNEFVAGEMFVEIDPASDSPDGVGWSDNSDFEFFNEGYYIEYAVPEPSAVALAAVSLLAVFHVRTRRRRLAD